MTDADFKYDAIPKSSSSIRLVTLHTKQSNIVCTLQSVDIEDSPPFEALSYHWGSRDDEEAISLNGQPFKVSRNLYAALETLKRIESKGEPGDQVNDEHIRCLWIDAICIDQTNTEERSHQVKLMWKIYSRATRVLVWLGEEKEDSRIAMEMIKLLSLNEQRLLEKLIRLLRLEAEESRNEESTGMQLAEPAEVQEQRVEKHRPQLQLDAAHTDVNEPNSIPEHPAKTSNSLQQKSTQIDSDDDSDDENAKGSVNFFHMSGSYRIQHESSDDLVLRRSFSEGDLSKSGTMRRVFDEEEQSNIPFHMLLQSRSTSDADDPPPWKAIMKLMQRPWWQRVWVIQEVAAAQNVLVGCGSSWLSWDEFVLAQGCVERCKDILGLDRLHRFSAEMKTISDKVILSGRTDGRLDDWNGLLILLYESIDYHASDPRDKIYALMGFAPSLQLEVNYKKPITRVYEEVVRKSIQHTGNLHILCLCRRPKRLELPSWIPDFSTTYSLDAYNIQCPIGFFGADGNNWHNMRWPSPGCTIENTDPAGHIKLRGFQYDEILAVGPIFQSSRETRFPAVIETISKYERLLQDMDNGHFPERMCQHRQIEFWRTLIWNATERGSYPADAEYGKYFIRMREKAHYVLPLDDDEITRTKLDPESHMRYRVLPRKGGGAHYYEAFVRNGLNRRFFITKRGRLGSGPAELQLNDRICILMGMKTPAVLRRKSDQGSNWEWIGQAYVHGIMHGEALGELKSTRTYSAPGMAATNTLAMEVFDLV